VAAFVPFSVFGVANVLPLVSIAALVPYYCLALTVLEALAQRTGDAETAGRAASLRVLLPTAIAVHLVTFAIRHSLPADLGLFVLWLGRAAVFAVGIWAGQVTKRFRERLLTPRGPRPPVAGDALWPHPPRPS